MSELTVSNVKSEIIHNINKLINIDNETTS